VEWVDAFGNLVTNISESLLASTVESGVEIEIGGASIQGIHHYYAERPPGTCLALVGSSGQLEIAMNGGDAAATLHVAVGAEVRVRLPSVPSPSRDS
jgi:hypothetical protein